MILPRIPIIGTPHWHWIRLPLLSGGPPPPPPPKPKGLSLKASDLNKYMASPQTSATLNAEARGKDKFDNDNDAQYDVLTVQGSND